MSLRKFWASTVCRWRMDQHLIACKDQLMDRSQNSRTMELSRKSFEPSFPFQDGHFVVSPESTGYKPTYMKGSWMVQT